MRCMHVTHHANTHLLRQQLDQEERCSCGVAHSGPVDYMKRVTAKRRHGHMSTAPRGLRSATPHADNSMHTAS